MSTNELNTTAKTLLEIREQITQLQAEAEALTDSIKAAMVEQGSDTLTGEGWRASWKNVQSNRFDQKAFRAENPELAARYMKETTTTRFLVGEVTA